MTSSLLVSSCTFNRLGWEGTRGWTWTLLGLKRVAEADESASGWASVGPYSSRRKKMEEDTFMTLQREPEALPGTGKLAKAYLAGMQGSGCSGGMGLLTSCLSAQPPLVLQAWGEAAASDQQRLKKIVHKLVFEVSSTSQMSLLHAGATVLTPLHTKKAAKQQRAGPTVIFSSAV